MLKKRKKTKKIPNVEKTSAKLEHGILRIEAPKLAAEKEGIKKLTVN